MQHTTSPLFRITLEAPGRLRLGGELDCATAAVLDEQLRHLTDSAPPGLVVVDLADVTFLDCAALRPLLAARERLGHRLLLTRVSPPVHRILDLTDLTDVFLISP